jgi:hypothetical protein
VSCHATGFFNIQDFVMTDLERHPENVNQRDSHET